MARYVETVKAAEIISEKLNIPLFDLVAVFGEIPTTEVEESKHGYWIDKPTGRYCHIGSYCSACQEKSGIGGIESNRHKPYCPNCGAKMDGTPKERGGEK